MKKKAMQKPSRAVAVAIKSSPSKVQKVAAPPDKRPMRAPRRPAAARLEPQKVHGRQKRKGS